MKHLKRIAQREQLKLSRFEVQAVTDLEDDGRPATGANGRASDASSMGTLLEVSGELQIGEPVLAVEGIRGLPQILGGAPWRTS